MDLGKMTREFLQNLDEGNTRVDIHGYIQALSETLDSQTAFQRQHAPRAICPRAE